jgi:hypothetical protein
MILAKHTTRRTIMAAAFGLGTAAIVGKGLAFAQDATTGGADADDQEMGHGKGPGGIGHLGPDALPADVLAAIDEAIAMVQADRDAVAATADVTTVDAILSMAIALRDQAGMIDATADAEGFRATAGATGMTIRAAHEALEAAVGGMALPSMTARIAERLAEQLPEIEDALADLANNVSASGNADAQALLDIANGVYAMAQDANDAANYEVAGHLAHAAGSLGAAAAILIGEQPVGFGGRGGGMKGGRDGDMDGGRDGGRRGGRNGGRNGDDAESEDESDDDATATPTV